MGRSIANRIIGMICQIIQGIPRNWARLPPIAQVNGDRQSPIAQSPHPITDILLSPPLVLSSSGVGLPFLTILARLAEDPVYQGAHPKTRGSGAVVAILLL